MTQPFADALNWVPKSRALGATLSRAHDLARAQGHAYVTLEHLLLSLIEDPDAAAVLLACNVDLLNLNSAVTAHLQQQPAAGAMMPEAAPGLLLILEYAVAAARQSRRSEVTGAIVLAAIVGEGKSDAARLLQALGIRFEDAVEALKRTNLSRPSVADEAPPAPPAREPRPQRPLPPPAREPAQNAAPVEASAPADPPPQPMRPVPFDDDPVTTARRRVEAIRNGQQVPPSQPHAASQTARLQQPSEHQPPDIAAAPANWTPSPPPQQQASPVRSPRTMPPPVPPVAAPPARSNGANGNHAISAHAPWADANRLDQVEAYRPQPVSLTGQPIDPARLAERIPEKMQASQSNIVEIRIPRSAVLATAAALNAASGTAITRALSIRLKAPSGGFHIETAAPETQWFDGRTSQRDDEETRWRWIVVPQNAGVRTLQLSISMRTVAADGMLIESMLPEHQVATRVVSGYGAILRHYGAWAAAALVGATLALLGTGGWPMILNALTFWLG